MLLRYLDIDEKNLGQAYDELADTFENWNRTELKKYMKAYLAAPLSRYATHDMLNFLKKESRTHPEDCIQWISALYKCQKDSAQGYVLSEYTQILIEAYNSICRYDNNNPILEHAMDMFDELLRSNVNNRSLGRYLREVS